MQVVIFFVWFINIIVTYLVRSYARLRLQKLWFAFTKLPKSHRLLLPDFPSHMKECFKAAEENSKFLNSIVANAVGVFQNSDVSEFVSSSSTKTLTITISCSVSQDPSSASSSVHEARLFDMTKVGTTLRQFYRDWSKEVCRWVHVLNDKEVCRWVGGLFTIES